MTPPSVDGQHTLQSRAGDHAAAPAAALRRLLGHDRGRLRRPRPAHRAGRDGHVHRSRPPAARPLPTGARLERLRRRRRPGPLRRAAGPVALRVAEPDLDGSVAESLRAGATPAEAGRRAAAWTHEPAAATSAARPHVHTSSAEARAAGGGVCQDFAHVTLALLRAVGLPARYVSGYLLPAPRTPSSARRLPGESHAWVEFWAGGWVAVDPTSLADVGEPARAAGPRPRLRRRTAAVRRLLRPAAGDLGVTVEITRLG